MKTKKIIVGATGASGSVVLIQCLKLIKEAYDCASYLVMTENARLTLRCETDVSLETVESMADVILRPEDIGACIASGSFETEGMLIVPCSMKTVAGINSGYSDNLVLRAADVVIKEHRKLVLGVRESPFSAIHLKNMYELARLPEIYIMPLVVSFYQKPDTLEEMTRYIASRLLKPFGICNGQFYEWKGVS